MRNVAPTCKHCRREWTDPEEYPQMTSDIDTRPPETEHDISTLARLARTCVRHRWIVIIGWVAALVVINGISGAVGPDYRTDFTLPASETKEVQELLEANSPDRAGFTSQIVFRAPQGVDDPEVQATMDGAVRLRHGLRGHHRHVPVRPCRSRSARRHDRLRPARHRRHSDVHRTHRHRQRRSRTRARNSTRSTGSRSNTAATCSPRSSSPRARSTASSPRSSS